MPRRSTSLASAMDAVAPAPTSNAERLTLLMRPAGTSPSDDTLTMFSAGGREAEVEEVFRRIARPATRWTRWRVACATPEQAALVWGRRPSATRGRHDRAWHPRRAHAAGPRPGVLRVAWWPGGEPRRWVKTAVPTLAEGEE